MESVELIASVSIEQMTGMLPGPARPKSRSSTSAPVALELMVGMNIVVMLATGVLILCSLSLKAGKTFTISRNRFVLRFIASIRDDRKDCRNAYAVVQFQKDSQSEI